MPEKKKTPTWSDWLGIRTDIRRDDTRWLGRTLGTFLFALGLVAAGLFVVLLGLLFIAFFSPDDGADVRNIGLVLAAIIGAPFVMWRSAVAAKQAQIADESLFNDKINAAAEDLAARRQVTEVIGEDDARQVLSEWQDDLVTRAVAIDRLEGLVEERPEVAPRVARMLSVYVRKLSREKANQPQESMRQQFHDMLEQDGVDVEDAEAHFSVERGDVTIVALREWARGLTPVRSDMEKAAQTLGRLKDIDGVEADLVPIDLRDANLQGFDLNGLNFDKARMQGAQMQGATLWHARMQGADLGGAEMQGANLIEAQMQGADLYGAEMQGAYLGGAQFDEKTDFTAAVVQYAAVDSGNYDSVTLSQTQVNSLFGDGSVTLPKGITRPAFWPEADLDWDDFVAQWRAWQVANGYDAPR